MLGVWSDFPQFLSLADHMPVNVLKYMNISNLHKLLETCAVSFAQFKITVLTSVPVNTVCYVLSEQKCALGLKVTAA